MEARLIAFDDAPPIYLVKDVTVVGRTEDCDVIIDHKSVSKLHCVLVKTDGLILIRDLGSTNGTRVNGQRVRRAALLPNDQLGLAGFRYQVKFGQSLEDEVAHTNPDTDSPMSESESSDDQELENAIPKGPPAKRNQLPDFYPNKAK